MFIAYALILFMVLKLSFINMQILKSVYKSVKKKLTMRTV